MVAGHHNDRLAGDLRDGLAGYARQLDGQGFQPAQAAGGLGEHALTGLGGGNRVGIQRSDGGDGLVNQW